jgi:hypothetical protein
VIAATAIGLAVIEFEIMAFGAAAAIFANKGTLTLVTLVDSASNRSRNVPGRRYRLGFFEALSRSFRLAKPLRFEPFELFRHCLLNNGGKIAIGNGRSHERPQSLQLVAELSASRELNLVPGGR